MSILIKTVEQAEGIRKSSRLAAKILRDIAPFVVPGATTGSIDAEINRMVVESGAVAATLGYKSHGLEPYPKSSCISRNEVICHGIPSDDEVLTEGDIVNVDVTTILDGYYGDTSVMFLIGEVSDEAKRLVEITKKCLDLGIEQVKPGNRIGQIGHAIATYAESEGCSVVEMFGGHGTGVRFHEPPFVKHKASPTEGPVMVPGMTFTIEPMINLGTNGVITEGWVARTGDGKLSAQYEHTVLVTEFGVEILTV